MLSFRWSFLVVLAAAGCGGDDAGPTASDGSTGTATDASSSGGILTGSDTSVGTSPTSHGSSGTTSATSADSTGDSGSGTAGLPVCDFEETLSELATGKTEPVDCGVVSFADDDQAWIDANACAVDALMSQSAFKVGFEGESIDSIVYDGFFGTVGIVYGLGTVHYDTLGETILGTRTCEMIVPAADCTPANGTHCLECISPGQVAEYDCVP